jgi:hypothetical protein
MKSYGPAKKTPKNTRTNRLWKSRLIFKFAENPLIKHGLLWSFIARGAGSSSEAGFLQMREESSILTFMSCRVARPFGVGLEGQISFSGTRRKHQVLPKLWVAILFLGCLAPASANTVLWVQTIIAGTPGVATPDIQRDLSFASAIYAQASIDINFLPTETSTSLSTNLVQSDAGVLPYFQDSNYLAAPYLTVFYVATIDNNASNRGTSTCFGTSSCAAWVANSAVNDTFAHELAHLLTNFQALWDPISSDPSHSSDSTNLLAPGGSRNIPTVLADVNTNMFNPVTAFDRIAPIQAAAMQSSQYIFSETAVPEPGSASLIGAGTVFLLVSIRVRRITLRF